MQLIVDEDTSRQHESKECIQWAPIYPPSCARYSCSAKAKRSRPWTSSGIQVSSLLDHHSLRRAKSLDETQISHSHQESNSFPLAAPTSQKRTTCSPLHPSGSLDKPETLSPLSPSTKPNQSYISGRRKAAHVLEELLSTEKGYITDLYMLVQVFLESISYCLGVTPPDLMTLRRNLEDMISFHLTLVQDFERCQRTFLPTQPSDASGMRKDALEQGLRDRIDKIGEVFVSKAQAFKVYHTFCLHYSQVQRIIQQLQTHAQWEAYERRCSMLLLGPLIHIPCLTRRHSAILSQNHSNLRNGESKLGILDFLIKPIQRICKYPLLISQLKSISLSCSEGFQVVDAAAEQGSQQYSIALSPIDSAIVVMKDILGGLDDAQKTQDFARKTQLIQHRLELNELLPPPFMSGLGNCILSGPLHIVTHHSTSCPDESPLKIRYMGAFLYAGFIIFVKVKRGRIYEAKLWFPLMIFDMINMDDGISILPNTFRLRSSHQSYDLSTRNDKEKRIWVQAINDARSSSSAALITAPVRLRFDDSSSTHMQRNCSDGECSTSGSPSQTTPGALKSFDNPLCMAQPTQLSPILIKQTTSAHRFMVDRGLQDVVSDSILGVRAPPRFPEQAGHHLSSEESSRYTGAQNRLSRRQSVSSMFRRYSASELRGWAAGDMELDSSATQSKLRDAGGLSSSTESRQLAEGGANEATTHNMEIKDACSETTPNSAVSDSFPGISWSSRASFPRPQKHRRSNSLTHSVRELFGFQKERTSDNEVPKHDEDRSRSINTKEGLLCKPEVKRSSNYKGETLASSIGEPFTTFLRRGVSFASIRRTKSVSGSLSPSEKDPMLPAEVVAAGGQSELEVESQSVPTFPPKISPPAINASIPHPTFPNIGHAIGGSFHNLWRQSGTCRASSIKGRKYFIHSSIVSVIQSSQRPHPAEKEQIPLAI
ncbi:hypothetical protein FRC02_006278 [Tulasnella sp. 418]|nr:hypothetical protein FRC02_006278 [Tulasnella sp. 418]